MAQQSHKKCVAQHLFYDPYVCASNVIDRPQCIFAPICYTFFMTRLLQEAIDRLRQLPEQLQDRAARALITQLEEEPEPADLATIEEGRMEIRRGDYVMLEQWRHDMGLSDR